MYHRRTDRAARQQTMMEGPQALLELYQDTVLRQRTTAVREIPQELPLRRPTCTAGMDCRGSRLPDGVLGREG